MFRVGDLIRCKKELDNYRFTNAGVVCRVMRFSTREDSLGKYKVMYIKAVKVIDADYYQEKTSYRSFSKMAHTAEYDIREFDFYKFELYNGEHVVGCWD